MSGREEPPDLGETYEIRIQGHLHSRWLEWFEGFRISSLECGETVLTGTVVDQTVLHGVLSRIRDLNLQLISVNRVKP